MAREKITQPKKPSAFGPFGPRNLAEVYQHVEWHPDIEEELRLKLLWALDALASVHAAINKEPLLDTLARIPANVPLLRSYLKKARNRRWRYCIHRSYY